MVSPWCCSARHLPLSAAVAAGVACRRLPMPPLAAGHVPAGIWQGQVGVQVRPSVLVVLAPCSPGRWSSPRSHLRLVELGRPSMTRLVRRQLLASWPGTDPEGGWAFKPGRGG